jgi:predicted nucleic acid-binding Zn ribbon protein
VSDLEPVGRLLPTSRLAPPHPSVEVAQNVWREAAGEQVARHSLPIRMARDVLVVHCDSSTWASELTLLGEHLGDRLTVLLGERAPAGLRFEVGAFPAPPETFVPAVRREPDAAAAARARRLGERVADETLRSAVERAVRAARGTGS